MSVMLFQNKKMGLLSVGLACLLSGCSMPVMSDVSCVSSAGLQSTSTSVESEPAVSATQIVPAQRSKKDSMPTDSDFFKSDLASYTQTLSCFFHSPLQNTQEISLDYYLAYFLLYQTYEMNKETGCYTSDDRYFLKIPEQDLLQTAELYLGLSNFSISDISAWPFAAPENGICYFTQETSLPYSDTSITNITVDKETGKILVFADLYDSQYEDSTQEKTSLIYHFSVISAANGKTVYRLESITVQ